MALHFCPERVSLSPSHPSEENPAYPFPSKVDEGRDIEDRDREMAEPANK